MKNKTAVITVLFAAFMAGTAAAEEKFIEIKAKKFQYTPNIITVDKGDEVNIRLISEDVHHGFYIDGYEIRTSAVPGKEGSLKFTADKGGRFTFRCSVTCGEFHPYMVGYLVVEPNSRFHDIAIVIAAMGFASLIFFLIRKTHKENNNGR